MPRLRGRSSTSRVGRNSQSYSRGVSFSRPRGSLRGSPAGVVRRAIANNARLRRKYKIPSSACKIVPSPQGGATSNSYCIIKHKRKKMSAVDIMRRVGAPNTYIYQRPVQFIAAQGFQNANPFQWTGLGDLITMLNATPQNLTGGASPEGANLKTNRYELSSLKGELLLTNSSLASAYVEIYDIVCKRDSPQFSTSYLATQYELANPLNCWIQGVADITNSVQSLNVWQTIKSLPYDSGLFNDYFKVVRRHHVGMPQGSTHRHTVNLDINKIVEGELIQAMVGGTQLTPNGQNLVRNYKGLSMWTLVVAYGQPSSIPQEGAGSIVTTARVAIDVVQSLRYRHTYIQDNTRNAYYTDNLSTLGGENVVSIGAGVIAPNNII